MKAFLITLFVLLCISMIAAAYTDVDDSTHGKKYQTYSPYLDADDDDIEMEEDEDDGSTKQNARDNQHWRYRGGPWGWRGRWGGWGGWGGYGGYPGYSYGYGGYPGYGYGPYGY